MLENVPGAVGIDEAGRGPLAGPVAVAAVVLPGRFDLRGLDDSKKLDPQQRDVLARRIESQAIWAVEFAEVDEIDRLNILWATMAAMERVVAKLGHPGTTVLIDGDRVPRGLIKRAKAVVKGDAKIACIAAASIVAKTHRDRLMRQMASVYPQYGFEKHFGYATPQHLEALAIHGPCPIHRRSFGPIREEVQPCLELDV